MRSTKSKFSIGMQDLLKKFDRAKFTAKILGSSGKRIPAVSSFQHIVSEGNPLLKEIGIYKRLPGKVIMDIRKSNRMNKYMAYQITRLRRNRKDPVKFGRIAMFCITKSVAFRCSAINKVFDLWYGQLAYSQILSINRKAQKILNNGDTRFICQRVYIPKGISDEEFKKLLDTYGSETVYSKIEFEGSVKRGRPLGVPTPEGRLVLHMYNNMIQLYFEKDVLKSQHGFIPGRGTLSAGREVLSVIDKAKYVGETDLKGFFDNVSSARITEILLRKKVPKSIAYGLENINRTAPRLKDEDLNDESHHRDKATSAKLQMNTEDGSLDVEALFPEDSEFGAGYKEFKRIQIEQAMTQDNLDYDNACKRVEELVKSLMAADDCGSLVEGIQLQGALLDSFKPTGIGKLFQGVAQGAPTSPFLSILTLKDFLTQKGLKSISYADDPIFYSDEDFTVEDEPDNGIIISKEKSAGIKRDGKGLKPLKFLGLEYDGKSLKANTKSGVREEVTEDLINLGEHMKYNEQTGTIESMSKTNFFGFVMACLYKGNGNEMLDYLSEDEGAEKLGKVHSKSLAGMMPRNPKTYSSLAILTLARDLRYQMGGMRPLDYNSDKLRGRLEKELAKDLD